MSRTLPARPNIEVLKKIAKRRLTELRAADGAARLCDAQLAVAREFGFASWRKLKEHIDVAIVPARQPKTSLREIFPNLFLVHDRIPGVSGFTFLLRRKQGNFLNPNYNKQRIDEQIEHIDALGGVSAILVNGKHNAKPPQFPNELTDRYRPAIYISEIDAKTYRKPLPNVQPLKFQRQHIADDLEAIPFPGYSKGGMAYLWHNVGEKYLFAGISITRIDGEWRTWVNSTVPPRAFKAALAELKATAADVLVINSFANTEDPWFTFTAGERDRVFDDLIAHPNSRKRR